MDAQGKKVACIPCYKDSYNAESSSMLVFIVDLSRGGDDGASHTFRIDGGLFDAYVSCVLNSTLYLFERLERGVRAATVDLSKLLVENPPSPDANKIIDLTRESLSLACAESTHWKRFPNATPTPGGKIIIFSSTIDTLDKNVVDFELYDPGTNEWTPLPPIESEKVAFTILRFAFLSETTWFIETDKAGMFDLDLVTNTWQARDTLGGQGRLTSHFGSSFRVHKELGGLGFSDIAAFDIDESRLSVICCLSPNLADPKKGFRHPNACGAPFLDGDCLKFCQFQTALAAKTRHPLVAVDTYRFDFADYKRAKKVADRRYRKGVHWLKRKCAKEKKKLVLEGRYGKEGRITLRSKYSTLKQNLKDGLDVQLPARLDKSFNLHVDLPQKCSCFDPCGLYFLS